MNNLNNIKIMTLQETSTYLKVSKSFLYKLTSKKEIPFYKQAGKLIYFLKEEIDQWIMDGKIITSQEKIESFINNLKTRKNGK